MEVHLKPELEARIARIAGETGRDANEVIEELLQTFLDYDDWFRREVHQGLDEAERGLLLEHEHVVARVEQKLRDKSTA